MFNKFFGGDCGHDCGCMNTGCGDCTWIIILILILCNCGCKIDPCLLIIILLLLCGCGCGNKDRKDGCC
ncbi:MAG: chorion class high-cysteine HCB protein 13 [Clostridiales bacterium]|nr:chorion class high-cysteine HCB protein 13 [Clostridiales bacterium]